MASLDSFDPEFGYPMLVFVLSIFQLAWMAYNVGAARKKYDVKYPAVYSDKDQKFNCIQRVHQNTLEGYTQFLALMFLGALKHPILSAIGGLIIISGRFFYALGYYTGDPAKRSRGVWFHLGELLCLGCLISGALSLLGYL
ncbi:glutathione S-transferase 3, mitochondrial-like [Watersipora subatra]|uniref:glutathione S-transferase 3, mitochondrial-like n=1 Tax=Watersipora subatra TaxID=2589382 RepID=UPI00355B51CB